MKITDKDITAAKEQPRRIRVEGSFIILTYGGYSPTPGATVEERYLNDQGREVLRTVEPDELEALPAPTPCFTLAAGRRKVGN
jgi:hypothetical protein